MTAAWADVAAWLRANGWIEQPGRGGHTYFTHQPSGVKVTLRSVGRKRHEATPAEIGNIVREIERAGFSRSAFRAALGGRR